MARRRILKAPLLALVLLGASQTHLLAAPIPLNQDTLLLQDRQLLQDSLQRVQRENAADSADSLGFLIPALALKTNLLFDLATVLNVSLEVPIGRHVSLLYQYQNPWWNYQNRYCLEIRSHGAEVRWWFANRKRQALTGQFLGAYGFYGTADLQYLRKFNYQCIGIWSAGLTYGYAFPVSRHFTMELTAGVGYAHIPYQGYVPNEDWSILYRDYNNSGVYNYYGLTKLEVSLIWNIGLKDRSQKKKEVAK